MERRRKLFTTDGDGKFFSGFAVANTIGVSGRGPTQLLYTGRLPATARTSGGVAAVADSGGGAAAVSDAEPYSPPALYSASLEEVAAIVIQKQFRFVCFVGMMHS